MEKLNPMIKRQERQAGADDQAEIVSLFLPWRAQPGADSGADLHGYPKHHQRKQKHNQWTDE